MAVEKIQSFTVDHDKLEPGLYISRVDGSVTTYDLRTRKPNAGDYMDNLTMHSVEHLFATYVRSSPIGANVLYFGPMGCRTGFYLLLAGDYDSADIIPLMKEMFSFIASFKGEVPGASAKDCGNYLDMNLPMANFLARKFLEEVLTDIREEQLNYPV